MRRTPVLTMLIVLAATAAACRGQVASGPGICFAFNDVTSSPIASLPLVAGGELLIGFTSPATVAIERIDVHAGFFLNGPLTLQVYPFVGWGLGPPIAGGVFNASGAGWIPLALATPVALSSGTTYVLRLTIASGVVPIDGDASQPTPLPYAFSCGPSPPPMFPPCSSYPTLGNFAARLRFRALSCGPTPLASATMVGSGCGASPAATLGASAPPVLGSPFWFQVTSSFGGSAIHVFWALGPATAGVDPGLAGCLAYVDLVSTLGLWQVGLQPAASFFWTGITSSGSVPIPNDPALAGLIVTTQAIIVGLAGVPTPIGAVQTTNGLELVLGY